MMRRWLEIGLWCATAVLLLSTVITTRSNPMRTQENKSRALEPASPVPEDASKLDLESAVQIIIDGNLFRGDRQPADEEPPSKPVVQQGSAPPRPPKPRLELRGIIGGPPWDAVLDGVPGRTASAVVRTGDRVGGLSIIGLKRDTLLVTGFDTTWHLTIRRP